MNDPGLDKPIQDGFSNITTTLRDQASKLKRDDKPGPRAAFRHELEVDEQEEEVGFSQPKRWWFTSTAFPLIAGTFGPLANLFSVCALAQTWRVSISEGQNETSGIGISDPPWLLALNAVSLAFAVVANVLLLMNFAHRVQYPVAQSGAISLWYMAAIFLIVPLGLTRDLVIQPQSTHAFSQAYYYALISAVIYMVISTLLVFNALGAYVFKAYPPSFNSLTIPQRTLMLQTLAYILYLALGAGVFSAIEGWQYVDGLYWADYTLLTIGLGTDFPLRKTAARALLIPYAACGITMLGLLIGSVRGLVLERGKMKMMRRNLAKQREKVFEHSAGPEERWNRKEFDHMRRIERKADIMEQYSALGTSSFAYLIVWFMGALVFWFTEKKPQNWTYFEALYFAYTSLLTIGYGDFYPQSNSGKPFFVVWSLMAIPTVTVLISNMGGTVVGWLKEATLWVGQRTILPEKERHRVGSKKTRKEELRRRNSESDSARRLRGDVERLGEAVERDEEGQGRGDSTAAKIAHEISRLAQDVGKRPVRKYEWEDWTLWLELLGMIDENKETPPSEATWTWLGDDGPLFSRVTETEWLLGRLCLRLEKVLEQEIKGANRE